MKVSGPFYGRLTAFIWLNLTALVIREFGRVVNIVINQPLHLVNLPI